ncbi:MAG TPA: DNA polymerase III subunit gamma/tau [Tepidisphaeraceae bacterium]
MSYRVLAREYRSATFDEVVGQDHVAKTLKRAIESGRIAHAFLFCGTRGVGKTSMARILAKALNCEKSDKPTTEPCGKCNSCKAIAVGQDIDVIEIDAASNTQVEKTRTEIIENVQYRPARSRFKVFIIDEVHMLSKASFNALLKTLEEPPEHVKFILATTEPEKVLPTILSRCQRYDFRNISSREIADHLKAICKDQEIKAEDDALLLIAKAGAGSMRDALSLLDRLLSIGEKKITVELIEQSLGMPRTQVIYALAESIGEGNVKQVLETVDKLISGGLSADTLVVSLSDHLRNLLILRTCGPKSDLVEVPGIAIEELNKQASRFEPVVLTQDIAILEELRRSLRTSQAGRALLDATLVRLALAEQFASVDELIGRVDGAPVSKPALQKKKPEIVIDVPPLPGRERDGVPAVSGVELRVEAAERQEADDDDLPRPGKVWDNSGPSLSQLLKQQESSAPQPKAQSNVEPVDTTDLTNVWQRLIGALEQKSHSLPPLLDGAKLVGIENGQAIIRYPEGHASVVRMLERNGKKDTISDVLSGMLSQNIGLKFEFEQGEAVAAPVAPARIPQRTPVRHSVPPPAMPAAAEPGIRITEELRAKLRNDELIKAVIDTLGGEIVKVE